MRFLRRSQPTSVASLDDAALVEAARAGNKEAFVEIVARYQPLLCAVAYEKTRRLPLGEEVAQETFVTAWKKIGELRDASKLKPWLLKIAHALAIDCLRREKLDRFQKLEADDLDAAPGPDESLASRDEESLVWTTLEGLPENYRLPLLLCYREGQSTAEIARALDLSEDAVKQRLSRGREMLRERLSGLVEGVLRRGQPSAVFVLAVAAAIGALTAPAVVAAGAFSTGVGLATTAANTSAKSLGTIMKASKASLTTAALAVVSVPGGYAIRAWTEPPPPLSAFVQPTRATAKKTNLNESALFAEWRKLHEQHQPTPEALPALYQTISQIGDPFRRRAFRAALLAEWAEVDPQGGMRFFAAPGGKGEHYGQFFTEWLQLDPAAAITARLESPRKWESWEREFASLVAEHAPQRLAEFAAKLPANENDWDKRVADAFAKATLRDPKVMREAAEAMQGTKRNEALRGVAQGWSEKDGAAALAWVEEQPAGPLKDELLNNVLIGWAKANPVAALDRLQLASPQVGESILAAAGEKDFEGTLRWLQENEGKIGREALGGLSGEVGRRLITDPVGFMAFLRKNDPAFSTREGLESMLLNEGFSRKDELWEWVSSQPKSDPWVKSIRETLISSAAWKEPRLALQWLESLPKDMVDNEMRKKTAERLLNWDNARRLDELMDMVSPEMRDQLRVIGLTAGQTGSVTEALEDMKKLPAEQRATAASGVAGRWAAQDPDAAVQWLDSLSGQERISAAGSLASRWASYDSLAASEWIGGMTPGAERDEAAQSLAAAIAPDDPDSALHWAKSIGDGKQRLSAMSYAVGGLAKRDPNAARQMLNGLTLTPAERQQMLKLLGPTFQP